MRAGDVRGVVQCDRAVTYRPNYVASRPSFLSETAAPSVGSVYVVVVEG